MVETGYWFIIMEVGMASSIRIAPTHRSGNSLPLGRGLNCDTSLHDARHAGNSVLSGRTSRHRCVIISKYKRNKTMQMNVEKTLPEYL